VRPSGRLRRRSPPLCADKEPWSDTALVSNLVAVAGGQRQTDDTKPCRDKLAANLSGLMERGGFGVEDVARRAEVHPDAVRLVLAGEDRDLSTSDVVILAGAAGGRPEDLTAGIRFVPYGLDNRPGGEWRIDSID
jgi:hypothetical protein